MISHEQEQAYKRFNLPETYKGDLEPLEEPRIVFTAGIIPGLKRGFGIEPQQYPKYFRYWHSLVKVYIEFRLKNTEQGMNLPMTIGAQNRTIVVTFYPIKYPTPSIISMGNLEYLIHPDDSDEEYKQAFMAINQVETANIVRKRDPSIS